MIKGIKEWDEKKFHGQPITDWKAYWKHGMKETNSAFTIAIISGVIMLLAELIACAVKNYYLSIIFLIFGMCELFLGILVGLNYHITQTNWYLWKLNERELSK